MSTIGNQTQHMKYYRLYIFLFILHIHLQVLFVHAQSTHWKWANSYPTEIAGLHFNTIIVDHSNNHIFSGLLQDSVDFDPDTSSKILYTDLTADAFISKNDENNKLIWVKQLVGTGAVTIGSMACDLFNNIFITGSFNKTVDFDPDTGVYNVTVSNQSFNDSFILKLDSNGRFQWVNIISGSGVDVLYNINFDQSGNFYVFGPINTSIDIDPGPGTYIITGQYSDFIAKYDSTCHVLWGRVLGSFTSYIYVAAISVDHTSNVYIAGNFQGTGDLDPGPLQFNVTSNGNFQDIFLVKLDSSGSFLFAKTFGGIKNDRIFALTCDHSDNIILGGNFKKQVDFDPGAGSYLLTSSGNEDAFILKLNSSGNFIWAEAIQGNNYQSINMLIADSSNNIYYSVLAKGHADYDPGPAVYDLYSAGEFDLFISKLDSTGTLKWAFRRGGPKSEYVYWLTQEKSGDLLVYGYYYSQVLGLGNGNNLVNTNYSLNQGNAFVGKFSCHTTSDLNIHYCNNSYVSPSGQYTWTVEGTYYDTIPNTCGCDSLMTIHLTLNTTDTDTTINRTACDNYQSPSGNYIWTTSGVFMDTISNYCGFDSIITVNLTINYESSVTLFDTTCNAYLSPSGKYTWYASGIYNDTILNAAGCDSNLVIHLKINQSYYSYYDSACGQYTSPSGLYSWTSSGTYFDTLSNAFGCDSVITVYLTLLNSASYLTVNACPDYVSPSGNYTWTIPGIYMDTILNSKGCDSILTINVVTPNNSSIQNIVTCYHYTPPSGNYTWSTSGTYHDTLTNSFGCDSIITYNITIKTVDTNVTQNGTILTGPLIGGAFQWLDCNNGFAVIPGANSYQYAPPVDGSYALQVTQAGCTDTSGCYSVTGVGISEISDENAFTIYPNPSSGQFTILFREITDAEISISDFTYKTVHNVTVNRKRICNITTAEFAPGAYIICVKSKNGTAVRKLFFASGG